MQTYTIKAAAEKMRLTPVTIRYYDKEGLLPFIERRESGYRIFSESDLEMLRMIGEYEGTESVLKIIKTSGDVDESLFEIPADYQVMSY